MKKTLTPSLNPVPPKLIFGQYARQKLIVPSGMHTRPTLSRVRKSIFDSLLSPKKVGKDWHNIQICDICAGSGALGFEAISLGAKYACMIENNPLAIKAIIQNAENFQCRDKIQIFTQDCLKYPANGQFDGVFCDPPFDDGELINKIWQKLPQFLKINGWFIMQMPRDAVLGEYAQLTILDTKIYGASRIIYGTKI